MKKKISFLLSMFIALALLNACESDENQLLQEQTSLSSLSLEKANVEDGFMPLNYVPLEAAKRMTAEELEVWKEASTQFYLNYSFMDTKYYTKNKESILERVLFLVELAKENKKKPSKLSFMWEIEEKERIASLNKFKLLNYEDTTDTGYDPIDMGNDSTVNTNSGEIDLVWTHKIISDSIQGGSITLSTKYAVYKTEWGTFYGRTTPTSVVCSPDEASFSGEATFNVSERGVAYGIINGTFSYKKVKKNIFATQDFDLWKKY